MLLCFARSFSQGKLKYLFRKQLNITQPDFIYMVSTCFFWPRDLEEEEAPMLTHDVFFQIGGSTE